MESSSYLKIIFNLIFVKVRKISHKIPNKIVNIYDRLNKDKWDKFIFIYGWNNNEGKRITN